MSIKQVQHTIRDFLKKPFPLLDDFRSKLFLVIFCALFATFFLVFYQPLNLSTWNHDSVIGNFLTIWSAGFVGAIIISFTQFFLRPKFNLSTFTIGQFALWVLFEFFLLSIVFYFFYGESLIPFLEEFFLVFRHTISLTIIPYFLACLLIAVHQLSQKVNQENNIVPAPTPIDQHIFKDENDKIVLAIKPQQLLFLKSENNYTSVYFLQNEEVEKILIRTNLKKLEKELTTYPNLLRIHRSYMVNLQNIDSIQRLKGSFQVKMNKLPEMPLKVSDSYKAVFTTQIEKT